MTLGNDLSSERSEPVISLKMPKQKRRRRNISDEWSGFIIAEGEFKLVQFYYLRPIVIIER